MMALYHSLPIPLLLEITLFAVGFFILLALIVFSLTLPINTLGKRKKDMLKRQDSQDIYANILLLLIVNVNTNEGEEYKTPMYIILDNKIAVL